MLLYSKQIVQCLKFEKDCQLIEYIIDLCVTDFPNFGFYMYWDIFYEAAHSFSCKALYEQILKLILDNISYTDRQDLEFSSVIIKQLSTINQCPGGGTENDVQKQDRIQKIIPVLNAFIKGERSYFKLPFDYNIQLELFCPNVQVMNSKKHPVIFTCQKRLAFNSSAYPEQHYAIMYKHGDDLRQDALVVQLLRLMDTLWQRN